jgi:hypothetical protein
VPHECPTRHEPLLQVLLQEIQAQFANVLDELAQVHPTGVGDRAIGLPCSALVPVDEQSARFTP